jgi:hypothetical protein
VIFLVVGTALFILEVRNYLQRREWAARVWHLLTSWIPRPVLLHNKLYVGRILVGIDKLESDHWVEITIGGFNGCPRPVRVTDIAGYVTYSYEQRPGSSPSLGALPTPTIMPIFGRELAPCKEFHVCLQQIIPAQIVGNAASTLSNGLRITFGFENLNIEVNTLGMRKQITRLPLWDGVTVDKNPNHLSFGQVKNAGLHEVVTSTPVGGKIGDVA